MKEFILTLLSGWLFFLFGIFISWFIKVFFYRNISAGKDSDKKIFISSLVRVTILISLYVVSHKINKILFNYIGHPVENMSYLLIFGSLIQLTNLPKNILYLSDKYMPYNKNNKSFLIY